VINVAPIQNAAALARYFAQETAPMKWGGKVAELLQIRGRAVTQDGLTMAASGHSPGDGQPLYQRASPRRRLGWDVVFAPAKSISVAGLVGSQGDCIVRAHRQAVESALGLLVEPAAAVRVRGDVVRGSWRLTGAMLFTHAVHRTNREREPHLHSHLLIMNVTLGPYGALRALETGPVFERMAAIERVYNHELCRILRQNGIDAEPSPCGKTVITAIEASSAVHHAFSKAHARVVHQAGPIAAKIQGERQKAGVPPLRPEALTPMARQMANDRYRPPKLSGAERKLTRLHWRLCLDQATRDLIDCASKPSKGVRHQARRRARSQTQNLDRVIAQTSSQVQPRAAKRPPVAIRVMASCTTDAPALPAARILTAAHERWAQTLDRLKRDERECCLNAGLALAGLRSLDSLEPTAQIQATSPALAATLAARVPPAARRLRETIVLDRAMATAQGQIPHLTQWAPGPTLHRHLNRTPTHAQRP
jgi:conjugative relaxase-like TrwC/TraI family protein